MPTDSDFDFYSQATERPAEQMHPERVMLTASPPTNSHDRKCTCKNCYWKRVPCYYKATPSAEPVHHGFANASSERCGVTLVGLIGKESREARQVDKVVVALPGSYPEPVVETNEDEPRVRHIELVDEEGEMALKLDSPEFSPSSSLSDGSSCKSESDYCPDDDSGSDDGLFQIPLQRRSGEKSPSERRDSFVKSLDRLEERMDKRFDDAIDRESAMAQASDEKDNEIKELKVQLEKANRATSAAKQENKILKEFFREEQRDLELAEELNEELQRDVFDLRKENNDLSDEVTMVTLRYIDANYLAEDRLQELDDAGITLKLYDQASQFRATALQQFPPKVEKLQQEVLQLQKRNTTMANGIVGERSVHERTVRELQHLKKQHANCEEAWVDMWNSSVRASEESATYQKRAERAEQSLAEMETGNLQQKLKGAEAEREAQTAWTEYFRGGKQDSLLKLRETERKLQEMLADANDFKAKMKQFEVERDTAVQERSNLKEDISFAIKGHQRQDAALEKMKADLESEKARTHGTFTHIESLNRKINHLQAIKSELNEKLFVATQKVNALEKRRENAREKYKAVKSQREQTRADLGRVQDKLQEMFRRCTVLENERDEAIKTSETAQKERNDALGICGSLKKERNEARASLKEMTDRFEETGEWEVCGDEGDVTEGESTGDEDDSGTEVDFETDEDKSETEDGFETDAATSGEPEGLGDTTAELPDW